LLKVGASAKAASSAGYDDDANGLVFINLLEAITNALHQSVRHGV
jgi:hypothetical protein